MGETAFELEKVSKTYHLWRRLRRIPVAGVRDVSLAVPRGMIFGLLGLNGAGKTTAMKLLVGLLRPDSGTVRVLGGSVEDPRIRGRLGYLPEMPYLPQMMTARGLLRHYGRMSGLAGRHLETRVDNALATSGLAARGDEPLRHFSKGMLQRVAMAQVLLHGPEVIFVDEPMSGLDPRGIAEMRATLEALRVSGVTVCLNSHQIAEVERLCDRIGVMAGGRIVREGAVGELLALARFRRYRIILLSRRSAARRVSPVREAGKTGGWCIGEREATEAELPRVLAAERKKGSRILQILAREGSLEEVVLETIASAGRGGSAAPGRTRR